MAPSKIQRGTPAYRRITFAMLLAGLATFGAFYCVQPLLPLFSRALLEGLSADQGDDEFDRTLNTSIEAIYRASLT